MEVICPTAQAKGLRQIGTTGKSVEFRKTLSSDCWSRHSGMRRKAQARNPLLHKSCGMMDSGPARFTRAPE
jgi:hypothetical protein